MADDEEPAIDGFGEVTVGYNYLQLSLAILKLEAGMAAELEVTSGFTFTVGIGGDYSTNFGPAVAGTAWLGGIASMEYTGAGAKTVEVNGNPTLATALAENAGAAGKVHAAAARVLAAGMRASQRGARAVARGSRVQNSGVSTSLGGTVSTGGAG